MNRSAFFGAVSGLLGLGTTSAQTQSPTAPATNYVQTTRIVGMKVKDSNGEVVGTIKDVVLNRENGCIAYTVLSTGDSGTRLTGTTKTVAIPWTVFGSSSDPSAMTLTVDRERVYGAPAFEYSRINEYSGSYINDVYSYYGVQPIVTGSAAANSSVSASPTGLSAEASASTTPTATPSPIPSVTPTATPSASATVSPSPTAKTRPPWASAASRPIATPSASASVRKSPAESSNEEEEAPKSRHHRESTSPRPTASPENTPE
jgi:sporulation protein YlmC with PRC-barrel domain